MNGQIRRIAVIPAVMTGQPWIRGVKLAVFNVLRQLAAGCAREWILHSNPCLEAAEIDAWLENGAPAGSRCR